VDSKTAKDRTRLDPANNDLPKQVALARCAYSQADEGCQSAPPVPAASNPGANTTLAQMPRRMGPMAGRQGPPMGSSAYPGTWGPQFSPGHALIGAAIGFAFGAAAGSRNGVRGSLAVGTLVGLLGAGIGAGIPSFPSHYRRRGWGDDEEEASRKKPKSAEPDASRPESTGQIAAARPDPSPSTTRGDNPSQIAAETSQNNAFSSR
jgi:hypothetical protein